MRFVSESNGSDPNPWYLDDEGRVKIPPDRPAKRTYIESTAVKMARLSAPRHRTVVALLSLIVLFAGIAATFAYLDYAANQEARELMEWTLK